MSAERATEGRNAMKAKMERLLDPHVGKVDASDYGPEETDMDTYKKTGKQPVGRQARKRGGKLVAAEGDKPKQNAGRKARKAAHPDAAQDKALIDKIVKPEARRDVRADGGSTKDKYTIARHPSNDQAFLVKMNGRPHQPFDTRDEAKEFINRRTGRGVFATGGGVNAENWIKGAVKHPGALHKALHVPTSEPIPEKKLAKAAHSDSAHIRKMADLAKTLKGFHHETGEQRAKRKDGGKTDWSEEAKSTTRNPAVNYSTNNRGKVSSSPDVSKLAGGLAARLQREGPHRESSSPSQWEAMLQAMPRSRRNGSMPSSGGRKVTSEPEYAKGGRTAHASGGKTKGKTNVNVIISTGGSGGNGQPGAGVQPPLGAAPSVPPMPMPNAAMPGTSPMPPVGAPAPAAMPRKRGGRA
jgi:hypothetical protein